MNRNKQFIKNTIILFLGKFTTQFMSFLLLPLFTHYLLTDDYGTVDLLQTYITLFVPALTLRLDSAIFRFLIDQRDNEKEKKRIISNTFFLLTISILLILIVSFVILKLINIKYINYVLVNLLILMISSITLQLLRGLGKTKNYSIASIITGVTTLLVNIILIVVFKFGANSILIASTVANIAGIIYSIIITKLFKYISFKYVNKNSIKELIKYSLPMIPNALSWWIVNVSDRTIISYFLGVAFNGVYTVSCKFSNMLNSIYSIFNMSWQETAALHINDEDCAEFFTEMINEIFIIFSSISLLFVGFLPLVYNIVIGEQYINSYNYIPILLYANSWNVLISLIGGIYVAKKRTKEIASTTMISAIINIIINVLFVKVIGLYAACFSTLISYMIMVIYRYIDCKKYVNIKLKFFKIILYNIIFVVSICLYYINNNILNILNLFIVIIYTILQNIKLIKMGYYSIRNKIKKI